ncbi:MAG: hypothetical protein AAFQ95_24605, partial [Cyanobacteria bacterium J06621_3]
MASLNHYLLAKVARFPLVAIAALFYLCLLFGGAVVIGVLSLGLGIDLVGVEQGPVTIGGLWMGLVISLLPNLLCSFVIGYWLQRKLLAWQTAIETTDGATDATTVEATENAILKGIPDLLVHVKEEGQSLYVVSHGMASQDVPGQLENPLSVDEQENSTTSAIT